MLLPVTADARLELLVLLLAWGDSPTGNTSSAMPLGSTEEHLDLYLGRDNRDNQPVAHARSIVTCPQGIRHPPICHWRPSRLLLMSGSAPHCNPRGRNCETPAQRSSGMSCVFPGSSLDAAVSHGAGGGRGSHLDVAQVFPRLPKLPVAAPSHLGNDLE